MDIDYDFDISSASEKVSKANVQGEPANPKAAVSEIESDHQQQQQSSTRIVPLRIGLKTNPPGIVLLYDKFMCDLKKRRQRYMPLRNFHNSSNVQKATFTLRHRHAEFLEKVPVVIIEKFIRIIQEIRKGAPLDVAVQQIEEEYGINPNEDLNKVSPAVLAQKKEIMEETFLKNVTRPGDPGFVYDNRKEFSGAKNVNSEWEDGLSDKEEVQVADKIEKLSLVEKAADMQKEEMPSEKSMVSEILIIEDQHKLEIPVPEKLQFEAKANDHEDNLDSVSGLPELPLGKFQSATITSKDCKSSAIELSDEFSNDNDNIAKFTAEVETVSELEILEQRVNLNHVEPEPLSNISDDDFFDGHSKIPKSAFDLAKSKDELTNERAKLFPERPGPMEAFKTPENESQVNAFVPDEKHKVVDTGASKHEPEPLPAFDFASSRPNFLIGKLSAFSESHETLIESGNINSGATVEDFETKETEATLKTENLEISLRPHGPGYIKEFRVISDEEDSGSDAPNFGFLNFSEKVTEPTELKESPESATKIVETPLLKPSRTFDGEINAFASDVKSQNANEDKEKLEKVSDDEDSSVSLSKIQMDGFDKFSDSDEIDEPDLDHHPEKTQHLDESEILETPYSGVHHHELIDLPASQDRIELQDVLKPEPESDDEESVADLSSFGFDKPPETITNTEKPIEKAESSKLSMKSSVTDDSGKLPIEYPASDSESELENIKLPVFSDDEDSFSDLSKFRIGQQSKEKPGAVIEIDELDKITPIIVEKQINESGGLRSVNPDAESIPEHTIPAISTSTSPPNDWKPIKKTLGRRSVSSDEDDSDVGPSNFHSKFFKETAIFATENSTPWSEIDKSDQNVHTMDKSSALSFVNSETNLSSKHENFTILVPDAQPQLSDNRKSESDSESEIDPEMEPAIKLKPDVEPEVKTEPESELVFQPDTNVEPKTYSKAHNEPEIETKPNLKFEFNIEPGSDPESEPEDEVEPEEVSASLASNFDAPEGPDFRNNKITTQRPSPTNTDVSEVDSELKSKPFSGKLKSLFKTDVVTDTNNSMTGNVITEESDRKLESESEQIEYGSDFESDFEEELGDAEPEPESSEQNDDDLEKSEHDEPEIDNQTNFKPSEPIPDRKKLIAQQLLGYVSDTDSEPEEEFSEESVPELSEMDVPVKNKSEQPSTQMTNQTPNAEANKPVKQDEGAEIERNKPKSPVFPELSKEYDFKRKDTDPDDENEVEENEAFFW